MKAALLLVLSLGLLIGAGTAKADEQTDAKALLDKAIKAMGGQAKLAKLSTASAKGKLTGSEGGKDVTVELDGLWQGMSQYRADVEVQEGGNSFKAVMVFNGDMGWFKKGDDTKDAPEGAVPF